MEKRRILFGSYDTAATGLWTLTGWTLGPAQVITNMVDVPGRTKGPLDLSAVLTQGEPRFSSRPLVATFESSEGNRLERKSRINTMTNWLNGWRMNIVLPDDPDRYLVGRITAVEELYNDMAHASVQVSAECEPWLYSNEETVVELTAATEEQTATVENAGRLTVVPLLEIAGEGASVLLQFGAYSWALGVGAYQLPDLVLPQGEHYITYSGTGNARLTYREAVLA